MEEEANVKERLGWRNGDSVMSLIDPALGPGSHCQPYPLLSTPVNFKLYHHLNRAVVRISERAVNAVSNYYFAISLATTFGNNLSAEFLGCGYGQFRQILLSSFLRV